jgi:hypothetical protein
MKKKAERRTTVPNSRLFSRRRTRIPARVQAASELWLDLFTGFCDGLLANRDGEITIGHVAGTNTVSINVVDDARALADAALHQFEDRWPDVKLEGTRD